MFRFLLLTLLLTLLPAMATPVNTEQNSMVNLTSGRRMLVLKCTGKERLLTGRAPSGAGGPFRILSGAEVLWEGNAGQAFAVEVHTRYAHLLSTTANNTAWQDLGWEQPTAPAQKKAIPKHAIITLSLRYLPGAGADAGPALREKLNKLATKHSKYNTLRIAPGEYHFYPGGALQMSYYISNHDQQDIQPVAIPIAGQKNLTIEGNGATFVFHGRMQPILLMDCENVTLNNITIRHDAPYYNEGKIVEIKDGTTTLEYAPQFRWQVKNGRYYLMGDGEPKSPGAVLAFQADGQMVPTGRGGDIAWPPRCEQVAPNRVKFYTDAAAHGLSVGHILVQRHYGRPHPAMVLYRANEVTLNNVVFQDSQGMALVAQRSRNITIDGGGCICAPGRVYTVSADATHFSNCAGTITVKNALYEGMMDDAINVHSTCLRIEKIIDKREIIVRYMHHQAVGFEVFTPGESVQFIKGPTLENLPQLGKVATVRKMDETHLHLKLAADLPEGVSVGDAIENADWYPAVNFIGCTVRHNRARGSLFTTPKPVMVKDCKFIASHGSAILLAGDAQGWFESGRCLDVTITGNIFDHNLTALYQFTEGIISIYPEVKQPDKQQIRYHRNIRIEGNTFRTHRVPLLFAISADGIIFRNNTVEYDDLYPGMHNGKPYVLRHCGSVELQKL